MNAEPVKRNSGRGNRVRQQSPGFLGQRIEIRVTTNLLLPQERQDLLLQPHLLLRARDKSHVLGEPPDLLDVRNEQAVRVGPNTRHLVADQGEDPEAKQEMV